MPADLLARIRSELEQRLRELRPLLSEYERLLSAAEALGITEAGSAPSGTVSPSRVAAPARRGRGRRGSAAGAIERAASDSAPTGATPQRRGRAPRGAAQEAILAALGHGSHTASELVMVTAMSGPNIRSNLSRLAAQGAITKTKRDGKTAFVLSSAAS